MLKIQNYSKEDKRTEYNKFVKLPFYLLMITAIYSGTSWISLVIITKIIVDLYIFGILDTEQTYSKISLFIDSLLLLGTALIGSWIIIPLIQESLSFIHLSYFYYPLVALCSLLYILIIWYVTINIQEKYKNNSAKWKIKSTLTLKDRF